MSTHLAMSSLRYIITTKRIHKWITKQSILLDAKAPFVRANLIRILVYLSSNDCESNNRLTNLQILSDGQEQQLFHCFLRCKATKEPLPYKLPVKTVIQLLNEIQKDDKTSNLWQIYPHDALFKSIQSQSDPLDTTWLKI